MPNGLAALPISTAGGEATAAGPSTLLAAGGRLDLLSLPDVPTIPANTSLSSGTSALATSNGSSSGGGGGSGGNADCGGSAQERQRSRRWGQHYTAQVRGCGQRCVRWTHASALHRALSCQRRSAALLRSRSRARLCATVVQELEGLQAENPKRYARIMTNRRAVAQHRARQQAARELEAARQPAEPAEPPKAAELQQQQQQQQAGQPARAGSKPSGPLPSRCRRAIRARLAPPLHVAPRAWSPLKGGCGRWVRQMGMVEGGSDG